MFSARHIAVNRESQLAAELLGQGVTALGKANHAQTGLYWQAFFGLSIGLERLCKLIFISDHAIRNAGFFPTNTELRSFGHEITVLLSKCDVIGDSLGKEKGVKDRPRDPIHVAIEQVLSAFATQTRYYNLNHLTGGAGSQRDPIALWWKSVAMPICDRHYSIQRRKRDERNVMFAEMAFGRNSLVFHVSEEGDLIDEIRTFFARSGPTRIAQMYGRMYVLQIVRWLASILYELAHEGGYRKGIEELVGMHEHFAKYNNEDSYFRQKKTWSS